MTIKPSDERPRTTQLVPPAEGNARTMIIDPSDQVPRITLLRRFPVPKNFKVTPESRIERGKTWAVERRWTNGGRHCQSSEEGTASSVGHGRIPDERSRGRSNRFAEQPEVLQGAA